MACTGGYSITQYTDLTVAQGESGAIFSIGGLFNWDELPGTTVKFHVGFYKSPIVAGGIVWRAYLHTGTSPTPGDLVWTSITFNGTGKLYDVSGLITKPSGLKHLSFTVEAIGSVGAGIGCSSIVFVVEIE